MRRPDGPCSRRTALLLLAGASLAACANASTAEEPVWGKEPCAHCRMLVGDRRYAAQVVHDGERRFFDDPGCMVLWLEARQATSARAWVREADAGRWIEARSARYVGERATPMGFGYEAHSSDGIEFLAMRDAVMTRKGASR